MPGLTFILFSNTPSAGFVTPHLKARLSLEGGRRACHSNTSTRTSTHCTWYLVRLHALYLHYLSYLSDEDNIAMEQRANRQQSTRNETKRYKSERRYQRSKIQQTTKHKHNHKHKHKPSCASTKKEGMRNSRPVVKHFLIATAGLTAHSRDRSNHQNYSR